MLLCEGFLYPELPKWKESLFCNESLADLYLGSYAISLNL